MAASLYYRVFPRTFVSSQMTLLSMTFSYSLWSTFAGHARPFNLRPYGKKTAGIVGRCGTRFHIGKNIYGDIYWRGIIDRRALSCVPETILAAQNYRCLFARLRRNDRTTQFPPPCPRGVILAANKGSEISQLWRPVRFSWGERAEQRLETNKYGAIHGWSYCKLLV